MHGVEHTVRAGGDVCIAVAVIERRAVERANIVVRAVFLAAAIQTVDGQVLLVRQQIIEVLTDAARFVGEEARVLPDGHLRIRQRTEAGRGAHRVAEFNRFAGLAAVFKVKEVDFSVQAGGDNFLQRGFIVLAVQQGHILAHAARPLLNHRLIRPREAVVGSALALQAAGFDRPHLRQLRRIFHCADSGVLAECRAAVGQHTDFARRVVVACGHVDDFLLVAGVFLHGGAAVISIDHGIGNQRRISACVRGESQHRARGSSRFGGRLFGRHFRGIRFRRFRRFLFGQDDFFRFLRRGGHRRGNGRHFRRRERHQHGRLRRGFRRHLRRDFGRHCGRHQRRRFGRRFRRNRQRQILRILRHCRADRRFRGGIGGQFVSIRLSRIVCGCGKIRRQVGNGRRAISAQRNRLPEPGRNPRLIAEHFCLNHAGIGVSSRQRENPDDGVIGVGLAHQRHRVKGIAVFIHHAHVRDIVAGDEVEGNLIRRGGRGNRRGEARCRRCDSLRLRAAGQRRGNRALQVAQEAGIAVRNQQKPHHEQTNHQHDGNHHRQRALLAARRFLFHVLLRAHELVLQVIPT